MVELSEIYANFVVELRRGVTNLGGIPLEGNTVYPLLRRL